jgi:two-component system sensor histidine kinase HydH
MPDPTKTGRMSQVEAVISALPSGVITLDPDARITHANRAASRIFGRPPADLTGRRLRDLRGELEAMAWPTERGEILLVPGGRTGELQFNEHTVLGFSSRTVEDDHGNRIGAVVSFTDITSRKARERAEAHRRRLADIGRVVSAIAHEIRNPVFAIASLAQVLAAEDAVAADPDLSQMAAKILDETRRIGRLIEDLLGFSSERELRRKRVDVIELLDTVIGDMRGVLTQVGGDAIEVPIRLEVGAQIEEHRNWSLDPESVRQVISNLLRNSWQAILAVARDGPVGEGITVKVERVDRWLEIEIADKGVGIPEEKLSRVFDAFFTTRRGGTGLGLAIVDRLMRQHGGTVSVESQPRVGTTVLVRFPP